MPKEFDPKTSSLRPYKRCRTVSSPAPCATCRTQTITPTLDNLPVEIILRIVEEIGWDPVTLGLFMRTSHAISNAIRTNETSLTIHFTKYITSDIYKSCLLSTAPSRTTYMEPFSIEFTLRQLIRKLSFTSLPPFSDFLSQFNTAMQAHHPAVARVPLNGLMRVQRAFLDATEALGWAYHHNIEPPKLPFEVGPKIAECVERRGFEWAEEVHIREKIKVELPKASLFDLKRSEIAAIFQAQPQLCHCCHGEALEEHIFSGIDILYQMWDARIRTFREGKGPRPHPSRCSKSVCNAPSECVARDNVEEWIRLQDASTLAHLLEIIWIASQLYDYTGLKAKDFRGCEHATDQTVTSHAVGHSNSTNQTRSLNERDQQWDRVEMECIFREMCLESGPAFLYACRPPQKEDTAKEREKHHWAIQLMQRGVSRLHAYEAGEVVDEEESSLMVVPPNSPSNAGVDGHVGHAEGSNGHQTTLPIIALQSTSITHYVPRKTLQATLLQRFCHLQQCDLRMGWDEVFHVNAVLIDEIRERMEEERKKVEKEEERKLEEEKLRLAWSSAMAPKGGWEVKPTLLGATDVLQGHDTGTDCVVGTVNDCVGNALRKDGWMPGSFIGLGNGEEVGFETFTANGEQDARMDAFNMFEGNSSMDGANLSFKFQGLGSIIDERKRASDSPPICDGEGHAEDGSCELDGLLWGVDDTEKWDKLDEFAGNCLRVLLKRTGTRVRVRLWVD